MGIRSADAVMAIVLALLLPGCTRPSASAPSGTGPSSHASLPPRIVQGDTMPLALRSGTPRQLFYRLPHLGALFVGAAFTSSDSTIARVTPTGDVIAIAPGTVTITANDSGSPSDSARMTFRVVTPQQAAIEVALEVCPNDDEAAAAFARDSAMTSGIDDIHEFHDCQRLIEDDEYASLVGIFAHQNVRLAQKWDDFEKGLLAAVIVNFGAKEARAYDTLGIHPGMNCLVVRATAPDAWEAAVVNAPGNVIEDSKVKDYGKCDDLMRWPPPDGDNVTYLRVIPQRGVDLLGREIVPPVARWDWDDDNDYNYIGVKCDALTWCEIGPEDFEPSEPIEILDQARKKRPVIKGYYDQQYLANEKGDEPTNIFGTIFPGDHLKRNGQIGRESNGAWYHVAKISFEETNFYPGASREFRRYVRRYKAENPFPIQWFKHGRDTPYEVQPNPAPSDPQDIYVGRLNGRSLPDKAIRYHHHPGLKDVPPTVRWRWDLKDEMTWFSCPAEGCCEKVKLLPTGD